MSKQKRKERRKERSYVLDDDLALQRAARSRAARSSIVRKRHIEVERLEEELAQRAVQAKVPRSLQPTLAPSAKGGENTPKETNNKRTKNEDTKVTALTTTNKPEKRFKTEEQVRETDAVPQVARQDPASLYANQVSDSLDSSTSRIKSFLARQADLSPSKASPTPPIEVSKYDSESGEEGHDRVAPENMEEPYVEKSWNALLQMDSNEDTPVLVRPGNTPRDFQLIFAQRDRSELKIEVCPKSLDPDVDYPFEVCIDDIESLRFRVSPKERTFLPEFELRLKAAVANKPPAGSTKPNSTTKRSEKTAEHKEKQHTLGVTSAMDDLITLLERLSNAVTENKSKPKVQALLTKIVDLLRKEAFRRELMMKHCGRIAGFPSWLGSFVEQPSGRKYGLISALVAEALSAKEPSIPFRSSYLEDPTIFKDRDFRSLFQHKSFSEKLMKCLPGWYGKFKVLAELFDVPDNHGILFCGPGHIPSPHYLPAPAVRGFAEVTLGKDMATKSEKKSLAIALETEKNAHSIAEEAEDFTPSGEHIGDLSIITDEWVEKLTPGWEGLGHGIFEGMEFPKTASGLRWVIGTLLTEVSQGAARCQGRSAEHIDTFESRAYRCQLLLNREDGATSDDVFGAYLRESRSAYSYFLGLLIDFLLPKEYKTGKCRFQTKSFWMYRASILVNESWNEMRKKQLSFKADSLPDDTLANEDDDNSDDNSSAGGYDFEC